MQKFKLRVRIDEQVQDLEVEKGANLRKTLLAKGLSPYTRFTRRLNCGGRGICATCGVWILENAPSPRHWHDRLAQRFGYARLSCQIDIQQDMEIALDTKKWIWGKPQKQKQT